MAREPLPGLRGRRDPEVPELPLARQPVLLQRAVVLHHDRVADAAHEPAVRRDCSARGAATFEVTEDANDRVPRPDDRQARRLGVLRRRRAPTARSYYFNQHGEAALLRPTSTVNAFREAGASRSTTTRRRREPRANRHGPIGAARRTRPARTRGGKRRGSRPARDRGCADVAQMTRTGRLSCVLACPPTD